MDAQARNAEAPAPLGVIGCLKAGFETVGRNLWLVLLPVTVDLFLWLGPRLSIAPLLRDFASLLTMQPAPDPEVASQLSQLTRLLGQLGEEFNLFSLISGLPLLTVPSLLAQRMPGVATPVGQARVLAVQGALSPMLFSFALMAGGLVLGIIYLYWLAGRVSRMRGGDEDSSGPASEGETGRETSRPGCVGRFARALLFGGVLLVVGTVVTPLWLFAIAVAVMLIPPIGFIVWAISLGVSVYVVMHLLFVVHGVLLGGRGLLRSVWESILLIHSQLFSVIGLVGMVFVISQGLGFVWSLPSSESWAQLIGILGNACIATGLTAATFVFYQERIGVLPELVKKRRVRART